MLTRHFMRPVQVSGQPLEQDFVHQRALARSGHACDTGKNAERYIYIEILQVMDICASHFEPVLRLSADFRNRYVFSAAQVLTGDRFRTVHDILCSSYRYQLSAVLTRSGTDINYVVRCPHRVLIVLYDDQSISQIAKRFESRQQFVIIFLMQTDTRLIQNISDAYQTRADLCREPDSLRFAAGKCSGRAAESQILKAYIPQKRDAGIDFLEDLSADRQLRLVKIQLFKVSQKLCDGEVRDLRDVLRPDRDCER